MGISSCKAIKEIQTQNHVITTTNEQIFEKKNIELATSPSYKIPLKSNAAQKPQISQGPIINQNDQEDIWVPQSNQQLQEREGPSNRQEMPLKFEQDLISIDQFNNQFYEKDFSFSISSDVEEGEVDLAVNQQNQSPIRNNKQLDQAFIKRFKKEYDKYLKELQIQVQKDKEKVLQGNKDENRKRILSQTRIRKLSQNSKVKSNEKRKEKQIKQKRKPYNYVQDKPVFNNQFQFEQEQLNFQNVKQKDLNSKREIQSILKPRGRSSTRSLEKGERRVSFKLDQDNKFSKNNYAQFIHKININRSDSPHHYYSNLEIF